MGRLILTEDDKNDIKLQYQGSIDKKFYDFLKANVEVDSIITNYNISNISFFRYLYFLC